MSYYPATGYDDAVELTILSSNQLHNIINSDATQTISTESGEIPSIRKALVDGFYFKEPKEWQSGVIEANFNQLYLYTDSSGVATGMYFPIKATASNPITLGSSPNADWKLFPYNINNQNTKVLGEFSKNKVSNSAEDYFYFSDGINNILCSWIGTYPKTITTDSPLQESIYSPTTKTNCWLCVGYTPKATATSDGIVSATKTIQKTGVTYADNSVPQTKAIVDFIESEIASVNSIVLSDDYLSTSTNTAITPKGTRSVFSYKPTTAATVASAGSGRYVLPSTVTGTPADGQEWYLETITEDTSKGLNKFFSVQVKNNPTEIYSIYGKSTLANNLINCSNILAPHTDMPNLGIKPNDLIYQRDIGIYFCQADINAKTEDGYPAAHAGCLEVLPSAYSVIQRYTTFSNTGIFVRNLSPDFLTFGSWYKVDNTNLEMYSGNQLLVSGTPFTVQIPTSYAFSTVEIWTYQDNALASNNSVLDFNVLKSGTLTSVAYTGNGDGYVWGNATVGYTAPNTLSFNVSGNVSGLHLIRVFVR